MTKDTILLIILIALAVIAAIVLLIIFIKKGWLSALNDTINQAMYYAEHNIEGSAAKKQYVIEQVEKKCIELHIPYYLIKTAISKLIDRIVGKYNIIKKGFDTSK